MRPLAPPSGIGRSPRTPFALAAPGAGAPALRRAGRRRARILLVGIPVLAACATAGPAAARLSQRDLAAVSASPPAGARIPLDLRFEDAADRGTTTLGDALGGRPALLLPVDYTCGNVCDPMIAMSAAALAATGMRAGRDYGFALVGIDPRDGVEAARRTAAEAADAAPRALVGDAAAVGSLTRALGYGYVYDADTDSFAHPAAAMLLTGDGRVARVLSPLALNGRDLRLALIEAGEGRVGSLADRLVLLCYGFDAVRGVYTPLIRRILGLAAVATILAIAAGLLVLRRRERRS